MGLWRSITRLPGKIFDFRVDRWVGLDNIKNNATYFFRQAIQLYRVEKETHPETFEEAVERLQLTDTMLENQKTKFLHLTLLYATIAFALMIYGIYLFLLDNLMGVCIITALIFYALTNIFRYHFWYFQIKQKKLGCSMHEWFRSLYRGKT